MVVRSPVARSVLLLTLVLFTSCRDEAAEAFARAQLQHHALLAQAARPEDVRFDAVLADLRSVPAGSKHSAEAQKLLTSIEAGRGHAVRTPLALAPNGRRDARLEAQLAACARLAAIAGADGGVDQRAMVALEACRFQAEKLELRLSHPEDFEDGGEP